MSLTKQATEQTVSLLVREHKFPCADAEAAVGIWVSYLDADDDNPQFHWDMDDVGFAPEDAHTVERVWYHVWERLPSIVAAKALDDFRNDNKKAAVAAMRGAKDPALVTALVLNGCNGAVERGAIINYLSVTSD